MGATLARLLDRKMQDFALPDKAFERLPNSNRADACRCAREDQVAHAKRLKATYLGDEPIKAVDHLGAVGRLYHPSIALRP